MTLLKPKARLLILLLGALVAWQIARTPRHGTVLASNSGIYLTSAERLSPRYTGPDPLVRAMDQASALSLVSEDVDGDGVVDVVAGYRTAGGFALGFYRGSLDAMAPQTADSFAGVARNRFPAPFLPEVKLSASPIQPDFLASGALGSSDHDIVVGSRGGTTLAVMSLDGGQLQSHESVTLPGALTSLAAQHLDARQPYSQLLAGIQTDQGARILIFTGSPDGLRLLGATSLSFGATQIRFGDMDGDGIADAVVLADGKLSILNGKEVLNAVDSPDGPSATLDAIPVPFSAGSLALGSFVFDREGRTQMALLSNEGTLHIYAWSGLNSKAFTPEEIRVRRQGTTDLARTKPEPVIWNEVESHPAFTTVDSTSPPVLFQTRISGYSADDVMALDSRTGRLSVLAHPNRGKDGVLPPGIVLSRKEAVNGTVAALAARVNIDGRPGVVLIKEDGPALSAMMPLPDPTFTVNTTSDTITAGACAAATAGACSLREAIIEANAASGVDTIMLPAGTYTLTLAGANENAAMTGDLDIKDGLNIIGAVDGMGNPTSIIQAGTTASNGIDKVLSINPGAAVAFDTQLSNLEIRYGNNPSAFSGDGFGGGFDWDASGTGTLSVTNCYIHDNSTADGPGGGISASFTGLGAGAFTISNSKVQNNTSQRAAGTTGQGGGIFVGSVGRMAMSNTTISGNQALGTGGAGGGLYFVGPAGSLAIHASAISGNNAAVNGGGIYSLAGLTIDQGTVIANNTAGGNGGGLWSNLSSETTALSKVTITGNSAVSSGGGIQVDNSSTGNNLTVSFSRLANNTAPTAGTNINRTAGTVTAINDWWGTNSPALTIGGSVTFDPYITLTNSASPVGITSGATSTITASFLQDNHAAAIAAGNLNVLIGLPAPSSIFPDSPVHGTLSAIQTIIQANGTATETFTATTTGSEVIHAAIDGASVPVNISILAPPSITKVFGVASLAIGGTTTLSFTITNPNASAINGIALNDTFPAGLVVATPNGVTGSCGAGTITATAASNNLALTGGTLPASTPCTFGVNVQATAEGVQTNTTGNVSSTNAGTGNTASATLSVINPPSITAAFGAASIPQSGTTSLTFTISNPNTISTFTGLAFTDSLPAGLVVATPNALTTNCGGAITAVAGSASVSQVNASMAPSASCTISVNIAATSGGVKNNSVSVSSTNGGTGNTSNASLTVVGAPTITKMFGAASIPLNGSTSLTFNLTNPNAGTTLTGVGFADALPAGLVLSTPSGLSGSCGGGTITANGGGTSASLSGASLSGSATCTFTVNVTGVTAGAQNDTTGAVTSVEGGTGTAVSVILAVVAPPSLTKSFGALSIQLHGTTTLSFTVTNPAVNTVSQTGIGFTDNLPSGIFLASPNGLAGSCGGGTITALAGNSTLDLSGAVLPINSSCTFSLNVVGNSDGIFTNTTGAVSSTNGGTGNTASANLTVAERPTGTANFSPSSIPLNSSTTLNFTVANPAANVSTLTGLAFNDAFTGIVVASPNGLTGTCGGGTITATSGTSSVSLSGASLALNVSCTFAINVTGVSTGTLGNLLTVASNEGGTSNPFGNSLVVMGPPTISKVFGGSSVPLNGTTTLTFNIANPNMSTLNGIGFTDVLPSGLMVSTPNGLTGSCGGGTITATAGTNSVTLTGAALVPTFASSVPSTPRARPAPRGGVFVPATCTFAVNVTGTVVGSQNNVTGNITSTEGGTGGTATASLAVLSPPTVAETFGPSNIQVNGITSLSFALSNPVANTAALTGIALTDTLPAGLVVASPNGLAGGCGAGVVTATAAGSTISLSGGTLPVNTACSFHVNVTATTTGSFLNTTAAVTSTNGGTGSTASATLGVATPPTIATSFAAPSIPLNGSTTLSYTITNPAANPFSLTGVAFTDSLPAGLVVSSPIGLGGSCGGGTITAVPGASTIGLSGASLASNASCTLTVNVTGATAGVKNNSVAVTSTEGGTGNTSNSSVTVVAPAQIATVFGAASVPLNGSSTSLSFTVTNPNPSVGLTGIGFTDTLPAGVAIATPNGLTGSCGGGTITVGAGGPIVSLASAVIAASASCTFSINVTGTAAGAQNNTTTAVTSIEGGSGGTASASLAVVAPPSISKVFGVATTPLNGPAILTFTIANPAANTVALTGVAFTDNLPVGLVVATPSDSIDSCGVGIVTASQGSEVISLSSGTIPVNTSCSFHVTVRGTASGLFTNVTGPVTSANGGTGNTGMATLGVSTSPVITTVFGAASIPLNGFTTLSFTITNPAANPIALSGVSFTDNLPLGLVIAVLPDSLGVCGSGTVSAITGNSALSLFSGTIAPGSSCTFSISVRGASAGVKANSVTATSIEGGAGNTATASITVVAPAILTKSFGAASIALNGATTLAFTVNNLNASVGLTGIGFTDALPAGLAISTPNALTGSCGAGTITATAAATSLTLSSAALSASGFCTFSVSVTGTASGNQNNITSTVSSVEGGMGNPALASITVNAPPVIVKAFGAASVPLNGITSLSFTITNPAVNPVALTGVAFTDALPAGIVVNTPNGVASTCSDGPVTAVAGSSSVSLTGGSVPSNASCTVTVNVKGTASGFYTNTTGAVSSTNGGTGNTATATLGVASPPVISKSFGASRVALNGSTTLTFTIVNPVANSIPLTGVAFTDALPAGLVVSSPNGLTGACGPGTITAVASTGTVSLTGGIIPANGGCTLTVSVSGIAAGVKSNSVSVTSLEGGPGNTANATLAVVAPATIGKSFGAPAIALGGFTTLTFHIANPNAGSSLTAVGFSDPMPAGVAVSTPNGLTGSCGGGIITAPAASSSISLAGANLEGNTSCTFAVNVTGTVPGLQNNTTGAIASAEGGAGGTASASLTVVAPPTLTNSFGAPIPANGSTTLSFTLGNPNGTAALSGISFVDNLPSGLSVSTPNGMTGGGCIGAAAAVAGSSVISLSGATLAAGTSCTFSVNITGAISGSRVNTTSNITSIEGGTGATASATLQGSVPVILNTSPPGQTFIVDGVIHNSSQNLQWVAGSSHTLSITTPQPGAPGTQYVFANWSDAGTATHTVTAPVTASTYTVNFGTQYQLTTVSNPADGGSISPPSGAFVDAGQSANLTASPSGSNQFASWSGSVQSTNGSTAVVLMDAPKTIVANFRQSAAAGGSLSVDPGAVSIQYQQGSSPSAVTRNVSVTSTAPSAFTVTAADPWIAISGGGATPAAVQVTFNLAGLDPGTYTSTLAFVSATSSVNVPVTVQVIGKPVLISQPGTLNFSTLAGSAATQTQDILIAAKYKTTSFLAVSNASWLSVTATGSTTPATLHIQASPAGLGVGTYQGLISVTSPEASNSPFTISVTLAVVPLEQPSPSITGVSNGASFLTGAVAPNTIVSVFGSNFCLAPQVSIGGILAEILAAVGTQINVAIPGSLQTSGSADLLLLCNGLTSAATTLSLVPTVPAIFTIFQNGSGQGSIVNQDATVNGPGAPTPHNQYVAVYVTGFGPFNSPGSDGLRHLALNVTAFIGDVQCVVAYAGEAPGFTSGLQQINILIPPGAATGPNLPLRLIVNGVRTQDGVTIAVQ